MECQTCEQSAKIHIHEATGREMHLCETCAAKNGISQSWIPKHFRQKQITPWSRLVYRVAIWRLHRAAKRAIARHECGYCGKQSHTRFTTKEPGKVIEAWVCDGCLSNLNPNPLTKSFSFNL